MRTPNEINKDYFHLAAQVGDALFKSKLEEIKIEEMIKKMHNLNEEMIPAQQEHGRKENETPSTAG